MFAAIGQVGAVSRCPLQQPRMTHDGSSVGPGRYRHGSRAALGDIKLAASVHHPTVRQCARLARRRALHRAAPMTPLDPLPPLELLTPLEPILPLTPWPHCAHRHIGSTDSLEPIGSSIARERAPPVPVHRPRRCPQASTGTSGPRQHPHQWRALQGPSPPMHLMRRRQTYRTPGAHSTFNRRLATYTPHPMN